MGFLDMRAEIGDLGWEAAGASDSNVMILTCPECATSYFVDDSRIAAAGRTVKCSNCGARWVALPQGAEPPPTPAPPPPSAAPPSQAAPAFQPVDELVIDGPPAATTPAARKAAKKSAGTGRPARRDGTGKALIWAGSAAAAAVLIAGAIIFRGEVVRLFPASQAAYAGIGLKVSSLSIEEVRAEAGFQGGRAVLSVTGQIHNLGEAVANSPALRVNLLDRLGKPVATKVAHPIDAAVPGHAVRHFAISMVDPPANLHDLEVTFDPPPKGARRPVSAPIVAAPGPQPEDAKPLPPGSPDALPPPPR
jgi:predicted Zn finger-like uncharacterized protein